MGSATELSALQNNNILHLGPVILAPLQAGQILLSQKAE